MLRQHQFIDEIQQAVYAPMSAEPELLRDAAAEYSEACSTANARLRQVGYLLRQGLRSEALQEAEREPNLLDLVALLDFPEAPVWCALLQQWGMATPPALAVDVAADLNQAYADQEPLKEMLKKHRLLALARAPLHARIHTLRRIRQADPDNAAWYADLQALEEARLNQLAQEAERAFARADAEQLRALASELQAGDWLAPPAPELVARVRQLEQQIAARQARLALEQLEPELTAAYAAFDVEAGAALRTRWEALAAQAQLAPHDPLAERAEPALEWLADQDELAARRAAHQAAVYRLEEALADDATPGQLEKLYHAVPDHEEGVPLPLQNRLRARVAAAELNQRRKHMLTVVGIAGGLLLVAGVVFMLLRMQQHGRQVTASTQSLRQLIDHGRLDEADQFFDNLRTSAPKVAEAAEVQQQLGRLRGAQSDEQARRAAFTQAIEQAEAAGPEQPDETALELAREKVRTDSEKARLSRFESAVAAARRAQQKARDDIFLAKLAALRDKLAQLEESTRENEQSEAELAQLAAELRSLRESNGLVTRSILAQADPLIVRTDALRKHVRTRIAQQKQLREITTAVGDVSRFSEELARFATLYPEAASAAAFRTVAQEADTWQGMVEWSQLLAAPELRRLAALSPKAAQALLMRGQALRQRYAGIPLAEEFADKEPYLQDLAQRQFDSDDPPSAAAPQNQTKQLLNDPLIANIWMVQEADGTRYYLTRKPDMSNASATGRVAIEYLAGFDLKTQRAGIETRTLTYNDEAPQTRAARRCLEHLRDLTANNWEETYFRLLKEVLDDEQIDPILKLVLVQRIASHGGLASTIFRTAWEPCERHLKSAELQLGAPWMLPRDDEAVQARNAAEHVLATLPPWNEAARAAATKLREVQAPPRHQYHWIGWLEHDPQAGWRCRTPSGAFSDGNLLVIYRPADAQRAELAPVATRSGGSITWQAETSTAFQAGRPIFLQVTGRATK